MTAGDIRFLIAAAGLSNRQAATALGFSDEALIRKWLRGAARPSQERATALIILAAERLAEQVLGGLAVAVAGRVEVARLTMAPDAVDIPELQRLSPPVATVLRAGLLDRLAARGLTVKAEP